MVEMILALAEAGKNIRSVVVQVRQNKVRERIDVDKKGVEKDG